MSPWKIPLDNNSSTTGRACDLTDTTAETGSEVVVRDVHGVGGDWRM